MDLETILEDIRRIQVDLYGKEMFFRQDDGVWYSRFNCDYIALEQVLIHLIEDIKEKRGINIPRPHPRFIKQRY